MTQCNIGLEEEETLNHSFGVIFILISKWLNGELISAEFVSSWL